MSGLSRVACIIIKNDDDDNNNNSNDDICKYIFIIANLYQNVYCPFMLGVVSVSEGTL